MSSSDSLPDVIRKVQHSLSPYVKQRKEADHIRRILTVHLSQHVDPDKADGNLIFRPLSLVHTEDADISSNGFRGSRKEYVRCVRANVKARKEYAKARGEHQLILGLDSQRSRDGKSRVQDVPTESTTSLDSFLDLVRQKRRHERLRIIQDYIDMLSQKPAAVPDHLHPTMVLQDIGPLPQMPAEVLTNIRPGPEATGTDLKDLVDRLERSVLRAKMLLKREQKLLVKVREITISTVDSSVSHGNRLQALETTRNELINWIETELGKAGDESLDSVDDDHHVSSEATRGNNYINNQVALIGRQYGNYTKARQKLILALASQTPSPMTRAVDVAQETLVVEEQIENLNMASHVTSHYLGNLLAVSNYQKSAIQQKSYLTISMAKQLKEAGQGLERLAHESHLLPTYTMPSNFYQGKRMEAATSFADEISRNEKPDSSRRARAWVYAAEAAKTATNDDVLEKLEEGELAVSGARKTLSDLQALVGTDIGGDEDDDHQSGFRNIWATLDGNLGVIKRDDV